VDALPPARLAGAGPVEVAEASSGIVKPASTAVLSEAAKGKASTASSGEFTCATYCAPAPVPVRSVEFEGSATAAGGIASVELAGVNRSLKLAAKADWFVNGARLPFSKGDTDSAGNKSSLIPGEVKELPAAGVDPWDAALEG